MSEGKNDANVNPEDGVAAPFLSSPPWKATEEKPEVFWDAADEAAKAAKPELDAPVAGGKIDWPNAGFNPVDDDGKGGREPKEPVGFGIEVAPKTGGDVKVGLFVIEKADVADKLGI